MLVAQAAQRRTAVAQLTDEQLAFLDRHDVPLDRVFDATGMSPDEYKPLMSGGREWVAYGVSPCRAEGHTLRTRGGHCGTASGRACTASSAWSRTGP